ncbi:MAG: NAD-binding protein, partial [Gemmatimonadota bacterium]|nr:NAD-binding protein [Gemmatimonadota bacterium]
GKRRVRLPLHGARAVSRSAFDRALLDAACESGVEFWSGARAQLGATDLEYRHVHVSRESERVEVRARVVLDATGLGRGLTPARGENGTVRAGSRIGLGAVLSDSTYPVAPGDLHMVVAPAGYVGLVRDESGDLNVAAAVDPSALHGTRPDRVITSILSSCGLEPPRGSVVSAWQGTPALTRSPAEVAGERLFRLGDASGYVEPFTGEGMCWAMSSAVAVAPLALAGADHWEASLTAAWSAHHAAALRTARRLCRVLTPALRRPWLVQGALATLQVVPGLATPFVRRAARPPETSLAYSA